MARASLFQNKKFKRLVRLLNLPRPYVVGLLETMWHPCYDTGDPTFATEAELEAAAEWPGEPGFFAKSVTEVGLVDAERYGNDDENSLRWVIHDFWDHAPKGTNSRMDRELLRKSLRTCVTCGGEYRSSDPRSKYCSNSCRQKSYRENSTQIVTDAGKKVTDQLRNVTDVLRTVTPLPTPDTRIKNTAAAPPASRTAPEKKPRKPATGAHAELAEHYIAKWAAKYPGQKYPFRKIDGVKTAELLKAVGGSLEDAKAVIDRYIADESDFCRGHPMALLTSATQLPRYMVDRPALIVNGRPVLDPRVSSSIRTPIIHRGTGE